MTAFNQPVVQIAPTAPIALSVDGAGLTMELTTAGSAGAVTSVNGLTGAVTITSLVNPMTGVGDTMYGGAAGAVTRLPGDTSNIRKFLRELSIAGVAQVPAWDTLLAADVPILNQNTTGSSGSCTGNAATATNLAGGATLPAYLAPKVTTLAFVAGGTTLVDASLGNAFNLTLTASTTTLGNPSNPVDGELIRFRITQGGAGSFTLAYGTAYDFGAAGAPVLSTAAGKVDILGFEYVASIAKWCYLGSALGN